VEDKLLGFNIILNQRYFHFVTLIDTGGYSLQECWKQVGDTTILSKASIQLENGNVEIEHRRYKSEIAYPHGELLKLVSLSKQKSPPYPPPYYYDIFGFQLRLESKVFFILAFPFLALGRDTIDTLITSHGLLKRCDFLKVNLFTLLNSAESLSESGRTRAKIKGLRAVIIDDQAISSLTIGGDDPLKSLIYTQYLQNSIRNGSPVEQCTVLCEPQPNNEIGGEAPSETKKLRVQMRIHSVGVCKFYIHIKGENLATVPRLVQRLESLNCFDAASGNPFNRVEEEEI